MLLQNLDAASGVPIEACAPHAVINPSSAVKITNCAGSMDGIVLHLRPVTADLDFQARIPAPPAIAAGARFGLR